MSRILGWFTARRVVGLIAAAALVVGGAVAAQHLGRRRNAGRRVRHRR
jgi:hypothetical protein